MYHLAYRHQNGEVEGFTAVVFTAANGKEACIHKMIDKCNAIGQPFNTTRVIYTFDNLTAEERATIRRDWRTE